MKCEQRQEPDSNGRQPPCILIAGHRGNHYSSAGMSWPQRCTKEACPLPAGHDGIHQIDWRLSPQCVCGHRRYDHTGGRCTEATRRCQCGTFREEGGS